MATSIGKVWVEVYYAQGDEATDAIDAIESDDRNVEGIADESIGMTRFTDEECIAYYLRLSDIPGKSLYTVNGDDGMPLYAISSGDSQITIWKNFDLMINVV